MILDFSVTYHACPLQQELHGSVFQRRESEEHLFHPLLLYFMIVGQVEGVAVVRIVQPPKLNRVNADVNPSVGHRPDPDPCDDLLWLVKHHLPHQLLHSSLHPSLTSVTGPAKQRGVEFTPARKEARVSSFLHSRCVETWIETDLEEERKIVIL